MRGLDVYKGLRGRPLAGYGFALAAYVAAFVLRLTLDRGLPPGFPYLTFFPAVILTAFVAGLGPGIVCAVLSGVTAWYFFIPPFNTLEMTPQTAMALGFYVFIVTVDIMLIHLMVRSVARLADERRLTATLYEQQTTMFQELQHRVANNMAFIASLLHLQRRRAAESPELTAALDSAIARIDTMSRVHRRLYDPAGAAAPVESHLQALVTDLVDLSGARNVTTSVSAAPVEIDVSRLITLSMLVTEVVMNSLKHAFVGRDAGHISVSLLRRDDGRLDLRVSDNGRGMSGDKPGPGGGLGSRIVENLGQQLRGELTIQHSSAGVTTQLVFPDERA